ncbi:hypothetical protein ACS0TY_017632 [Phlomoides rotata]
MRRRFTEISSQAFQSKSSRGASDYVSLYSSTSYKSRIVKSKYIRPGRTVSKYFHRVLNVIIKLHPMLLARPASIDDECNDNMWKFVKNCLSALDGSYVINYYLCDGGYPNGDGFLSLYRGIRYHLKEWGSGASLPQNREEYFNMKHARARNVIERSFGVLKKC